MTVFTRATLRILGDDLRPDEVSREMGMSPDRSHSRGDVTGKKARVVAKTGYWSITSSDHIPKSHDFADHVAWLCEAVAPRRATIAAFQARNWRVDVYIGIFTSAGYGGPALPARVVRALADLELDVNFDLYPDVVEA